jgi:adenine-specific DNA-methyltransferase
LKKVISGDQSGISKDVDWKGGGDFVYMELAKWNEAWIEKIRNAKTEKELAQIWNKLRKEAFLSFKINPNMIDENAQKFQELDLKDQRKFLMECLDKNHLYVNYNEMNDKDYDVSKEDKALNNEFYKVK